MLTKWKILPCVLIIVAIFGSKGFSQWNYCEPELCKLWNGTDFYYYDHVGCENNDTLAEDCTKDASMMRMTQRKKDLILDLHNIARNKIALGEVKGYSSASTMYVLKWDTELEYLAGLNVKTCKFAHDACRNTERFSYSGQNIGISWQRPPFHSNTKRINIVIRLWYNEHKDANQSFVDAYENHPEGKKIGHFMLLVADRAKRVGCSAIRFSDSEPDSSRGRAFLMTCNYDFATVFSQPVYKTGSPAANCTKISKKYPGLCDWNEEYDVSEESEELDNTIDDLPLLF